MSFSAVLKTVLEKKENMCNCPEMSWKIFKFCPEMPLKYSIFLKIFEDAKSTIFIPSAIVFGYPDVFRLRKEPINSLSYVRAFVSSSPTALTVRYFFLIFCTKLGLHSTSMPTKKNLGQKIFLEWNSEILSI